MDQGIANMGEGRDQVQGLICWDLEILGTFYDFTNAKGYRKK